MQRGYDIKKANIVQSELDAFSIMQKTPVETVKSILNRIGLEYMSGLPKDVYIVALKTEICNNGSWLIKILPEYILEFLMDLWEEDEIELVPEYWDYLQYLRIFGLADYKKGNLLSGEPSEICVVSEMKDCFYFLLKSRKSRQLMETYVEWEKIIAGLIYYYGMIDCYTLHEQFMKITKKMIPYKEFITFMKCRCTLWSLGLILKDVMGQRDYFQYINVENGEILLMYIREHSDIGYKMIEKEDLFYISESAGIDNRWPGVSELGTLCIDELHMDYYQATVLIKSVILMIQNGDEWEKLIEKMQVLSFQDEAVEQKAREELKRLYENVPVYELKGHTRKEYNKMFHQKQLKKKREMFTIIEGKKGSSNNA